MNEPQQPETFTREELYERVWSTPIQTLAHELGISGRGLAKICERMEIPVPPRGYWRKLETGKSTPKFRLPPASTDTQLQVTIRPTPQPFVPPPPPNPT